MDESKRKTLKTEDRISALPDDVICDILSLLYTKDAVRTSVLSTRWRYLFASVTVLRLSDGPGLNESREVRGRKFTEFVNALLNRHDVSDISLFDLYLSFGCYDISDVNSWISSAIRRNVQNIKCMKQAPMNIDSVRSLVPDLFTCKTLVDLVLYGAFDLSVPESVCLPNLKTCRLGSYHMKFIDDGSSHRLFSSCPKLEKLYLWRCKMGNIKDRELNIPSLKMFIFNRLHAADNILLSAPNLEYFEYRGGGPSVLCKGVWKSIVMANIMIRKDRGGAEENMSQLANNLIEVKYLSLYCHSMELLQRSRSLLPTFNKLTHLELEGYNKTEWKLLPTLLHRAPCLEVLVIHKGFNVDYIYDEITASVPICLTQQLKVAMVYVSNEGHTEFKWIKFLLKIARVLEKLTVYLNPPITAEDNCQWRDQIREKLLTIPRISETCQVEIAKQDKDFLYGHVF